MACGRRARHGKGRSRRRSRGDGWERGRREEEGEKNVVGLVRDGSISTFLTQSTEDSTQTDQTG